MPRTRGLLALAVLVVVAAAVPAGATPRSQAPRLPACPLFTDPAGDDKNADTGLGEDPALDLVGVRMGVARQRLTITLTLTSAGQPTYAEGARYLTGFTFNRTLVELFGTQSLSDPVVDPAFAVRGLYLDGRFLTGSESLVTQVVDTAARTVTLSISTSDLQHATGAAPTGRVGGLHAHLDGTYAIQVVPYDDAVSRMPLPLDGCR